MSRTIRIDAEVMQLVLDNQRDGETKQATLRRLVMAALHRDQPPLPSKKVTP